MQVRGPKVNPGEIVAAKPVESHALPLLAPEFDVGKIDTQSSRPFRLELLDVVLEAQEILKVVGRVVGTTAAFERRLAQSRM
jgi:hypothetical protein